MNIDVGLLAYLVYNIVLLFNYDYYLQTSDIPVADDGGLADMPDILLCSSNAFIGEFKWFKNREFEGIVGPNVTIISHNVTGVKAKPCSGNHDQLQVLTFNGSKIDRNQFQQYAVFVIMSPFASNASVQVRRTGGQFIIPIPHQNNPYLQNVSSWPLEFQFTKAVAENTLVMPETGSYGRIHTTTTRTWLRRTDFAGLWGKLQEQPAYSLTSALNAEPLVGLTRANIFLVNVPVMRTEQSQLLVQTFQSAFSSWGGAFSVAWGLYYFLFGSPRMEPFGVVALYMFGRTTKRKVHELYLQRKEDIKRNSSILPNAGNSTPYGPPHGIHDERETQLKEQRHREMEARIEMLEAVLGDFYLDMALFRKENEEKKSWFKSAFRHRSGGAQGKTFIQIEEGGPKTSFETHRMGQL
ncbi:hypothetical protein BGX28_000907 [Mortierella sp. GBA30]|nr:hypothetical protein BGX28_000907 [Mortierella sp. GBA30]